MSFEIIDESWDKFIVKLLSVDSHPRLTNTKNINSWQNMPSSTLCWFFQLPIPRFILSQSTAHSFAFFKLPAFSTWENRQRSFILTSFSDRRIQSSWKVIIQYHITTDRSFFVYLTYWRSWRRSGSRSFDQTLPHEESITRNRKNAIYRSSALC